METDLDVLIIGAGPAGSSAAALLHRERFKMLVVEKQTFPRFVIGESLLPHCMDLLKEADLLGAAEAQHFMHKCGAVFRRDNETCNFDFSDQFTAGWKYTFQVTRADFDKALADAVAARGVDIRYGHGVTALKLNGTHTYVTVQKPDGTSQEVRTRFVLDCSGYGRTLPRLLNLEEPSSFPPREALFVHVTGDRRPGGREEGKIWACIHPGGAWIWIIPFSNGKTSVGAVGSPEFFQQFPEDPEARIRAILMSDPNAGPRLSQMKVVFGPQRIAGYACAIKQLHGNGFALAGNATEFLDPIFSSGVTLALASANRAAKVLTRHLRGENVDWETEYAEHVMQGINTFRAYVAAWYDGTLQDIFFAAQASPDIMRQICSVLAGYVWDKSNPYVAQPDRALPLLSKIVKARSGRVAGNGSTQAPPTPAPPSAPSFFTHDSKTAYEAKSEAQRIAFAPVVFQACRLLRKYGLLEQVHRSGDAGLTLDEVVKHAPIPRYGVKVMLEAGLGIGLFCLNQDRFTLTKLGYFMLRDAMTQANMDMAHDVCFRGLFHLDEAIEQGRPAGLKTLGYWTTFYEGLSSLPPNVRESWLTFDHYYSDRAFPAALPLVFANKPKRLLDLGGNTGKWALQCAKFDPDVQITIADLPRQLELARENVQGHGLENRVEFFPVDMLDQNQSLPAGHDAIWMSQFLDCFSEEQIVSILRRAAEALPPDGTLHVLELFWDRQPNETAAFCLQQTSLYFSCIANGNSQMYHSADVMRCLEASGLKVVEDRNQVGQFHTWLKCRKS
jgi:flavin-dependent dehydrogenase/ubiquinone/menaquinone biosynthesis C-methylase UbiE